VEIDIEIRIHWYFTTLALKRTLSKYDLNKRDILEIGTGPYALLSIFLSKQFDCSITACDINQEYLKNALKVVRNQSVDISIKKSVLYSNIDSKYDLIFFNSIYIPYNRGIKLGINKLHSLQTDWCGGETGLNTIEKYIVDSSDHLKNNGILLLDFNYKYLSENIVKELCNNKRFRIIEKEYAPFNPSVVYAINKQKKQATK
jgi:methylase of polypeptide subunit release factors